MKNIIEKLRIEKLSKVIICGLHSGIPECCVNFFVVEWIWKSEKEKLIRNAKVAKIEEKIKRNFYYIPCPNCLKRRNPIELIFCNCRYAYE